MAKDISDQQPTATRAHSRRAFLKGIGAASATIPLAAIGAAAASKRRMPDVLSAPGSGPLNLNARPPQAFGKRLAAAVDDLQVPSPNHPNNGDEAKYPSGIANFTKGFPHNSFGEIVPSVYASYLAAVKTGKRADFDALTLGGTEPLVDPQAGLAYDLETYDPSQNSIPPFNTLTSPGLAAQMIEQYWQALTRDVSFSDYDTDPTASPPRARSWAASRLSPVRKSAAASRRNACFAASRPAT